MSVIDFENVNFADADAWRDAAGARTLTTVGAHDAFVASLLMTRDILADPARVLNIRRETGEAGMDYPGKSLAFPMVPYAGPDTGLRGSDVPLIGAVPIPAHWRSGGDAPSDLPAWVRASDAERRRLYGATSSLLEELRRDAVVNPQTGTPARESGFAWAPVVVGASVSVFAVYAYERWMLSREAIARTAATAETERARVRETAESQRYGALLAARLEAAKARYEVAARTGVLPAPSPIESAIGADDVPRTGERPTDQRAASWWESFGSLTVAGVGGAAVVVVAALAGLGLRSKVAAAVGRARSRFQGGK